LKPTAPDRKAQIRGLEFKKVVHHRQPSTGDDSTTFHRSWSAPYDLGDEERNPVQETAHNIRPLGG
jgi:hypothetical protein